MSQGTNRVLIGGRGRGRLVPQEVLDAPLRKPGMPLFERSNISEKLSKLDILFTGPLEDLAVYRVMDGYLLRDGCSEADMQKMMEFLFRHILNDAANASSICKYLYVMFRHDTIGSHLRALFYKHLEKNFKESSRIKLNHGPLEYRNFILLFAAATHHARNVNFAPIDELIEGLLSLALNIVPSSLQEDIRVFSLSVIRYSQYLKMSKSDGTSVDNLLDKLCRLEEAQCMARQILLNYDISKKCVAWLCLVLECKQITNELLEQYTPTLGKPTINLLKSESVHIKLPINDFDRFSLADVTSIIKLV